MTTEVLLGCRKARDRRSEGTRRAEPVGITCALLCCAVQNRTFTHRDAGKPSVCLHTTYAASGAPRGRATDSTHRVRILCNEMNATRHPPRTEAGAYATPFATSQPACPEISAISHPATGPPWPSYTELISARVRDTYSLHRHPNMSLLASPCCWCWCCVSRANPSGLGVPTDNDVGPLPLSSRCPFLA